MTTVSSVFALVWASASASSRSGVSCCAPAHEASEARCTQYVSADAACANASAAMIAMSQAMRCSRALMWRLPVSGCQPSHILCVRASVLREDDLGVRLEEGSERRAHVARDVE